jgi:hypothetical protein
MRKIRMMDNLDLLADEGGGGREANYNEGAIRVG